MWESYLSPGTVDWLLEPENPSVRFLTLTRLLGEPDSNPAVAEARTDIMRAGIVPQILAKLDNGSWNEPRRFYRDKYRGGVWQLIILAEHLADGNEPRIHAVCEEILASSQDRASGGFSYDESAREGGGLHSGVVPCLTGNMVWSLLRLGYHDDERLQAGIDWITRYQRFDDGVECAPSGWPYDRYRMCWGTHVCHMGAVKALKALAEIPPDRRSPEACETIRAGCEYLLAHHIHKRSHDLAAVSRPGWLKLQFPLMYQTDVLEIAAILLDLGYRDERMQEAIDRIAAKRSNDGKWPLEATFNGRYQVSVEQKGKPSRWITLRALLVLKGYYR
ncbi:MAG TPA: nitrogen fixation protein NifH [Spirochaetia bacterium]|nr:nitrogen fixation protein NifH [Spirochaetia bacterium]